VKGEADNESCLEVRWTYPRGLPNPVVVDGCVAVRTSRPRRALAVLNKDTGALRHRFVGSFLPFSLDHQLWATIEGGDAVRIGQISVSKPWKIQEHGLPFQVRECVGPDTVLGLDWRVGRLEETRTLGLLRLGPGAEVVWQLRETDLAGVPGLWDPDPVASGGAIFVGKGDNLCCLDARDGRLIWKTPLGSVQDGAREPIVTKTGVIVGAQYGMVMLALDSGKIMWRTEERCPSTVLDDLVVGVVESGGGEVLLHRLADGKKLRTANLSEISKGTKRSTHYSVLLAAPTVVKGRVVFGDGLGYVWAFDPKRRTAESYRPDGCIGFLAGRPVATESGFLIVSTNLDARSIPVLYSFDANW
jgi:outer membrane protein assembly factor BamB